MNKLLASMIASLVFSGAAMAQPAAPAASSSPAVEHAQVKADKNTAKATACRWLIGSPNAVRSLT